METKVNNRSSPLCFSSCTLSPNEQKLFTSMLFNLVQIIIVCLCFPSIKVSQFPTFFSLLWHQNQIFFIFFQSSEILKFKPLYADLVPPEEMSQEQQNKLFPYRECIHKLNLISAVILLLSKPIHFLMIL